MLRGVLELLPQRSAKRQDKIRVVFEGGFCEQPPTDMLAVIQDACYIVDDDLLIGLRWLTDNVSPEGDPFTNLAAAYLRGARYSPVQRDPAARLEMLLRRLREARADAAIVASAKMCAPRGSRSRFATPGRSTRPGCRALGAGV